MGLEIIVTREIKETCTGVGPWRDINIVMAQYGITNFLEFPSALELSQVRATAPITAPRGVRISSACFSSAFCASGGPAAFDYLGEFLGGEWAIFGVALLAIK